MSWGHVLFWNSQRIAWWRTFNIFTPWLDTAQYHYNVVIFLQNPDKRHPIARPLGWGMGCLLWVQTLFCIMPQSLQWYMQYHVILCHVIPYCSCWPLYDPWRISIRVLTTVYLWLDNFQRKWIPGLNQIKSCYSILPIGQKHQLLSDWKVVLIIWFWMSGN